MQGHGFEPWSGKTPHAAEQLSPWTTTTEACMLQSQRVATAEASAPRAYALQTSEAAGMRSLCMATGE